MVVFLSIVVIKPRTAFQNLSMNSLAKELVSASTNDTRFVDFRSSQASLSGALVKREKITLSGMVRSEGITIERRYAFRMSQDEALMICYTSSNKIVRSIASYVDKAAKKLDANLAMSPVEFDDDHFRGFREKYMASLRFIRLNGDPPVSQVILVGDHIEQSLLYSSNRLYRNGIREIEVLPNWEYDEVSVRLQRNSLSLRGIESDHKDYPAIEVQTLKLISGILGGFHSQQTLV